MWQSLDDVPEFVWGALVLVAAFAASVLIRKVMYRGLQKTRLGDVLSRQLSRFISLIVFFVGAVMSLNQVGIHVGPMIGALGVGGIAIAFAAQDILANFLAGIMIQARRPFRVGEQISTLDYEGTVQDIDMRAVHLETYDGLDVILPNAEVLRNPIINHTRRPTRRTSLTVGVSYSADLETARDILLSTLSEVPGVSSTKPPQVWFTEFGDSSLNFEVMFWHGADIASVYRTRSAVGIALKKALDEAGIEIPFPQRTVWMNPAP